MPGIKDCMSDILAQLSTLQVTNPDETVGPPYVRVWNNQLKYDEEGMLESFPKPALFLEIQSPVRYEVIGQGYRDADINARIHIIHEYMNDADGVTYEQDLVVFGIRDSLVALLTYYTPSGCGAMVSIAEEQDTAHTNLYHLIVDFTCNFTDAKGSRLDTGRTYFTESTPPTALEVQGSLEHDTQPQLFQLPFIIPKR